MSKILFVTQKLTPNSLNQIEIIKRSGHEFTVVTSQSEKNKGLVHSDTLYFFTRWSFLELIKFLPPFMIINPDIVHVFVDSKPSVRIADFFSALAKLFQKIFSLQFFLSEDTFLKIPRAKKLIYHADIVTGPHRTFLYHLRGMKTKNKYQIKGVIPPVLQLSRPSSGTNLNSEVEKEFDSYQILLPLKKGSFNEQLIILLAQRFSLLLAIDLATWSAQEIKKLNHLLTVNQCRSWRLFPLANSLSELDNIPKASLSFWIAGLEFELEEYIQFFEFSLDRRMKIVMDHTQARLYPDLWEHNPVASIATKSDILNFISSFNLDTASDKDWQDPLNTKSLVDISVNEFNRLISKVTNTQNEKTV